MDDPPLCKQCLQANRKTKLCLYHLNFNEALYMCPVKKCFFPLFKKEIREYIVPYKTSVSESDLCDSEEELNDSELNCVERLDCDLNISRIEKLNLSECLKTSSLASVKEINVACQISHVDNFELVDKYSKKNSHHSPRSRKEYRNNHVSSVFQKQTANINGELNVKDMCSSASQIGVSVLEHSDSKRKVSMCSDATDSSYIFPVWHDQDSLSWLDASIALLVCNKKLKDIITRTSTRSHLKNFCCVYSDALCRLNTSTLDVSKDGCQLPLSTLLNIKKELKCAQEEMFNYLQPNLCPDSKDLPVFAIDNLLKEDAVIGNLFLVSYGWDMTCWSCGACIKERKQNMVLNLSDGCPDFSAEHPYYKRPCPSCKKEEQKMFFHFTEHPPKTMLLYFGAGSSSLNITDLHNIAANKNHYHVTGILQYVVQSSHYIAWIRNPVDGSWLCFDDWGPAYQQYSYEAPQIPGNEISLVMWEQDENASKTSAKIGGIFSINEYLARLKSLSSTTSYIKNRDKLCKTLFSNSNFQAGNRAHVSARKILQFEKNSTSGACSSEKVLPNKDMFVNKENFVYDKTKPYHYVGRASRFNWGGVRDSPLSVLGHSEQGKLILNGGAASNDYSSSNFEPPLTVRNVSEKLNVQPCVETDKRGEEEHDCPLILQAVGMIRKSDYDKVVAKQSKSQRAQCFSTETSLVGGLFPFQNSRFSKPRTTKKCKEKSKRIPRAKKAKSSSDAFVTTKSNKKSTTSDKKPYQEDDIHSCPEAVMEVEVSTCSNVVNSLPSFRKSVCKKKTKTMTKTKTTKQQKNEKVNRTKGTARGRKKLKTVECKEGKDAENFESSSQSDEEQLIERYRLFTPINFSSPPSEYLSPSAYSTSIVEQSVDSFDFPGELVPVPSPEPIPEENMDSKSSEDVVELRRSTKNYSHKSKRM